MTLLRELGVRVVDVRTPEETHGFPIPLVIEGSEAVLLDLPEPGFLSAFDPTQLGVAILDSGGMVRRTWGLANRMGVFRSGASLCDSNLGELVEGSLDGNHGALYLEGYRFLSCALGPRADDGVALVVVSAQEELAAKRQAARSWRVANTLRRLGKTLTMNQQVQSISIAAAHEIASVTELAAVLIWTVDAEENFLKLAASVGANRAGTNVLSKLALEGGSSCVAELVATTRTAFAAQDVSQHLLTCELEAKFCYLRPGGVSVHPLVISDRLIGVLELVGREEDPHFESDQALFQTIAEHFALALNAAMMFEDFEKLATRDALTGIANHRHLQEFLHQRVVEAARTGQELGAIMLDVDHFRSFNEEEGHDAGDEVLRLVADSIKACIRPYDLAARYGGEEFSVIMPGSSLQTTQAVAERIRQRVESLTYSTRSGRDRHVTVSLGVAIYPNGGVDAADILKAADVALYEAKRGGRNKVVCYSGQSTFDGRREDLDLAGILAWIPEEDRPASEAIYASCLHEIAALSAELSLTPMQTAILQGLARVVPTVRRVKTEDPELAERMLASDAFRILVPNLEGLEDRFEIKGQRIPVLSRALLAILCSVEDGGRGFTDDPGRFDPEIAAMVLRRKRAA